MSEGLTPTDALRIATDALAKAMRAGAKKDEVSALISIAQALLQKDGPRAALTALTEPVEKARKMGFQDLELKAQHLVVAVHLEQGNAAAACAAASELRGLAAKAGPEEVAAAKLASARAGLLSNSSDDALEDATSALTTFRERGNLKEQGETLLLLAEIFQLRGQAEDAERRLKASLSMFKEAESWKGAGTALQALVQLYSENGQYKAAKEVAKEELDAFTGRDKVAEAMALNARVLPYIGSTDFAEALRLAEEGLKKVVSLGNREAEASLILTLATVYASMGHGEDAIAVTKRALSLSRKLGSREGEKAAMRLLSQIHAAKSIDPPSSSFRAESLRLLQDAVAAAQESDKDKFVDAVTRLGKLGGFLTKKDVTAAMAGVDQQSLMEFLQTQAPSEISDFVLESAKPVQEDREVGSVVKTSNPVRCKESNKLEMYGGLRIGNLVYGPRFRQISAFVPFFGYPVVHSIVRPSSLADDWEQEGWDWNPAVIDAAAHSGFALSSVA